MLCAYVLRYLKIDIFLKFKTQILKKAHLGFLGSFGMLFLVLQAHYGEKISLMRIFSLVNPNAPGLCFASRPGERDSATETVTDSAEVTGP